MKSGGSTSDIYYALQFAGRLNFRPGVSKTFVLVTCSSQDMDGTLYGDSLTMIKEQNITVHHLSPRDFHFKGMSDTKRAAMSKMYGYDEDGFFTKSSLHQPGEKKGDRALRRQLRLPKDYLSALARESGGTVFNLQRFDVEDKLTAKMAATVLSKQVALRAEPSPCQVCDCLPNRDGKGHLQCHKCILPEIDIVLRNWNVHGGQNARLAMTMNEVPY